MREVFVRGEGQKGVALVIVLMLSVIGIALILGAIYLVNKGISASGINKRYQTVLEASQGGTELFTKEVLASSIGLKSTALQQQMSTLAASFGSLGLTFYSAPACLNSKLNQSTALWTGCPANAITPSATDTPDMKFTLAGATTDEKYDVYVKITDTVQGNSSVSRVKLDGGGVMDAGSGMVTPPSYPYMYRIEIQGQKQSNTQETASLTVSYAY